MNIVKQLEGAPRNLILYALGLIGAVVDDYTLVTLTIFCVLLGFAVGSVLIAAAAFFGLYFVLRLVLGIQEIVGAHAAEVRRLASVHQTQANATHQIAAAIAQNTSHERDNPPPSLDSYPGINV